MHLRTLLSCCFTSLSLLILAQAPTSFTSYGVGGGGALFAPSINPANDNEYYVGCDMSELFHTTDFGSTNTCVPHYTTQGGHYSAVQFTNSNVRYSIDYASGAPGYVPIPVKSADAGATWTTMAGNPDNTEECFSINADYSNPNRVLISYYGAIYYSSNGGTSFTSIYSATNSSNGVHVAGVFFDDNNIFIGTNEGLIVSTNGGTSFAKSTVMGIPATQGMFSFAGAKSGGTTRLLCLTGTAANIYVGYTANDYYGFVKGVYTIDWGALSWSSKTTGINLNADYMMFVGMAKNDINTMYLAGSKNAEPAVMKTTNAGTQWSHVMTTASNGNIKTGWCGSGGDRGWSYAECPFGFTVAPNNSSKILFTDFGFVHKSSDGGTNWQQAYLSDADQNPAGSNTPKYKSYHSSGLENTTCWQVVWGDANTLMAGFSDIKGVRSTDGGSTFGFNYTGHGANSMYRIAQHPNGTWYAGTSNIHDMYQSTRLADAQLDAADAQGKVIMSTDKGATWTDVKNFGHPVFWVALDPNNATRAYASVIHSSQGGIYVTNNLNSGASSTWTKLSNPPRTQGHPASIIVLNDGKVLCTYSGRRASAFTNSSGCFLYNPANSTWSDVSHSGMYYWTKDVVLDPSDASQNTWYVCVFSGWGGAPNGLGGLYKTTNRGSSWTKLTGSQFDRVTSITFNPNNNKEAYLTTEVQGLWISSNMDQATPTWTMVNSYPFRQPERVFFNPYNQNEIWVTSFGNGLRMGNSLKTYTIAATAGTGGSINPSGVVTVDYLDSSKFTITPAQGFIIDSIIVDGSYVGKQSSYTFYQVMANHTIRAVFAAIPTYSITASSDMNGTITPSGTVSVLDIDSAAFTYQANPGYHLDSVIVDNVFLGTPASYTFYNVMANHTIRVVFAENSVNQMTIVASAGPGGSISPKGNVGVPMHGSQSFSITPDAGYLIDSVLVDEVFIGTPSVYNFPMVMSDRTIRAVFAENLPDSFLIVASAGPNGTISPADSTYYLPGTDAGFFFTADAHYLIDSVFVDGAFIGSPANYLFQNVNETHTIHVVFKQDFTDVSENASALSNWNIYPNPAKDKLRIELNLNQSAQVAVVLINALGQQFELIPTEEMGSGLTALTIDLYGYKMAAGIYTACLRSGPDISTKRISITN